MSAQFDEARIDRLLCALTSASGALVAVSGGPDSMALVRFAADWARRHPVPVFTATVDHGLRPEARAEAEQVAAWAKDLGLRHAILSWEGDKPRSGIQERARAARYGLLLRHAKAVGADHLLTAHHADDQAETVLFRLLRGSGVAGLAGMRTALPLAVGVTHLRPLLAIEKAELVDYCRACGQAVLRDPSNENPRFARARLRRLAPLLAREGLDTQSLLRLARRAARADAALEQAARALRADLPAERGGAAYSADLRPCLAAPEEIFLRLLEMEIQELRRPAGPNRDVRPDLRLDRLENLAVSLRSALADGRALRTTLAGMVISLDRHGRLGIRPENPRRRGFRHIVETGKADSAEGERESNAALPSGRNPAIETGERGPLR